MKKNRKLRSCTAACLALGVMLFSAGSVGVQAAEVIATVEGTVLSGTTSDILKLSTKEGNMEIKLDSSTDTSECKILLPGNKATVSVSHGSDGYLHAVKIGGNAQVPSISYDSSTTATVTGTIGDKTAGDILHFKTPQGEMEIKLDATTNMSGCKVLVVDKSYSITCVRGSDAYMHAVSISDSSAAGVVGKVDTSITPAPASAVTASTMTVTGKVSDKTKAGLLYFDTKDGEMQIVIDNNTDSRNGLVLTPGRSLTVTVYNGSDEYLHAASIIAAKESTYGTRIDTANTHSVSGTVGSKSTENVLYLKTPQGDMELKMDAVRSVVGCKVFISGQSLTVVCARGDDAYMHALDITGA